MNVVGSCCLELNYLCMCLRSQWVLVILRFWITIYPRLPRDTPISTQTREGEVADFNWFTSEWEEVEEIMRVFFAIVYVSE